MPIEEDYVRAALPDPSPASSEDRNVVMAAVLSNFDSPTVAQEFMWLRRSSQTWTHRLAVVGVGTLILAVFFIPIPRTSLFGLLDRNGGSRLGQAETFPAGSAKTPKEFALWTLNEARNPPHAHLTTRDLSGSLERVFETPDVVGLIDLHRFYLVDELAGAVEGYVQVHLPKGAQVTISTGFGTAPTGGSSGYAVSLPVSGPHQHLAELVYYFQPVGTMGDETEIRVDSQTVWEPSRSAEELAPSGGIVEVIGFSQTGGVDSTS
ncbi:MAG: hypothetical protein ABSG36_14925 [Acidimicrobiales bacterium]|jgi:hypothetical protein